MTLPAFQRQIWRGVRDLGWFAASLSLGSMLLTATELATEETFGDRPRVGVLLGLLVVWLGCCRFASTAPRTRWAARVAFVGALTSCVVFTGVALGFVGDTGPASVRFAAAWGSVALGFVAVVALALFVPDDLCNGADPVVAEVVKEGVERENEP